MNFQEAQAICNEIDNRVIELNVLLSKAFDDNALRFYISANSKERFPLDIITSIVPKELETTWP